MIFSYLFLLFPCISRDCVQFMSLCETKYQNAALKTCRWGHMPPIVPPCYATGYIAGAASLNVRGRVIPDRRSAVKSADLVKTCAFEASHILVPRPTRAASTHHCFYLDIGIAQFPNIRTFEHPNIRTLVWQHMQ